MPPRDALMWSFNCGPLTKDRRVALPGPEFIPPPSRVRIPAPKGISTNPNAAEYARFATALARPGLEAPNAGPTCRAKGVRSMLKLPTRGMLVPDRPSHGRMT